MGLFGSLLVFTVDLEELPLELLKISVLCALERRESAGAECRCITREPFSIVSFRI